MRHHISLGLDDLRTVVALAEELNYHRAAHRVGKTQSGVTRAVARVEKHVGTRLFERSHSKNHSVSTTDAGVHYVARARLAIAHSESAELAARETLHGVNSQINVGKSVFTDRRLLTILRSIELPLHPGLEVRLPALLAGICSWASLAGFQHTGCGAQPRFLRQVCRRRS